MFLPKCCLKTELLQTCSLHVLQQKMLKHQIVQIKIEIIKFLYLFCILYIKFVSYLKRFFLQLGLTQVCQI